MRRLFTPRRPPLWRPWLVSAALCCVALLGAHGRVSHVRPQSPGADSDPGRCSARRHAGSPHTAPLNRGSERALSTEPLPHLRRLTGVFWVHVPKGGTSFGLAILNYACPALPAAALVPTPQRNRLATSSVMAEVMRLVKRLPETLCDPAGFEPSRTLFHHDPLPDNLAESGRGLTLIRDPRNRLYSAFASRHHQGMHPNDVRRLIATVRTPQQYAAFPGIRGCQVKMLVGRQCASAYTPTGADLAEAKRRLGTAFGFVGLTDHYDLSVCLLHAMWGGVPKAASFQNVRPTANFSAGYTAADAAHHLSFYDDPLDAELYLEAKRLFVARLQKYGFAVPPELLKEETLPPPPRETRSSARGAGGGGEGGESGWAVGAAAVAAVATILLGVKGRGNRCRSALLRSG